MATFSQLLGMSVYGGELYVADSASHVIRVLKSDHTSATFVGNYTAGNDDKGLTDSTFGAPTAIAFYSDGTMFIADASQHNIRRAARRGVDLGRVERVPADGPGKADGVGTAAHFNTLLALAIVDDTIYVPRMRARTTASARSTCSTPPSVR